MFPKQLNSKPVFRFFKEICAIPHVSGDEERISKYLVDFAKKRNLEFLVDPSMNVLIKKPGTGSPVALQAHMDMVGEKIQGSSHDFGNDPIKAVLENGWLTAKETTLGADNGIGVALMLELLDIDNSKLPPLECLFTVDEERGLVGAIEFPPEWITAKSLINLDSEDLNSICIGCAGGADAKLSFVPEVEDYSGNAVKITIENLTGGHSGIEIGKNLANAIQLITRVSRQIEVLFDGRLVSIKGGTKHNAIPRDAEVILAVNEPESVFTYVALLQKEFAEEYSGIENSLQIKCEVIKTWQQLTKDHSTTIIDLLLALPHGVEKMSGVVEGLVETSCNLAIVNWIDGKISVLLSVRSAVESAKSAHCEKIASIGRLAGMKISIGNGYPGWTPNSSSELLQKTEQIFQNMFDKKPIVGAIHAGLECGIIGKRVGNLDMISLGPDIKDVHIPGESVSVDSVDSFIRYLITILEELSLTGKLNC